MHVRKLIEKFESYENMPIEIGDVRAAILELGVQEKVVFSGQELNPGELRGAYYRYTQRPNVYGEPERVSLVIYCNSLSLEWQRLICCKEAVHIFDAPALSPKTEQEVLALAENLVGPMSTDAYGTPELMAMTDRFAIYQAAAVLFPEAAREVALREIEAGNATPNDIAKWVCLPQNIVDFVLRDTWPRLMEDVFGRLEPAE